MNNYPDNFGLGDTDRRGQEHDGLGWGEMIGAVLVTTVFDLGRARTRKGPAQPRDHAPHSANDEVILEASGWR